MNLVLIHIYMIGIWVEAIIWVMDGVEYRTSAYRGSMAYYCYCVAAQVYSWNLPWLCAERDSERHLGRV